MLRVAMAFRTYTASLLCSSYLEAAVSRDTLGCSPLLAWQAQKSRDKRRVGRTMAVLTRTAEEMRRSRKNSVVC